MSRMAFAESNSIETDYRFNLPIDSGINLLVDKISETLERDDAQALDKQIKVLVVDDLPAVRESLRTILTLEDDIQVVGEATNGKQAVELARQVKPNVVIMDLEMPGCGKFDGIDACAQIKAENLAEAVIVLTIHADMVNRERASLACCDLFLEKGLSSEELIGKVRQISGK